MAKVFFCKYSRYILLFFLSAFILQAYFSLRQTSVCIDEFAHLPAGIKILKTGNFESYPENPPLARILLALPVMVTQHVSTDFIQGNPNRWALGYRFMVLNAKNYMDLFMTARILALVFCLFFGLLLYYSQKDSLGPTYALIPVLLFCFSPSFLSHGSLVGTDGLFAFIFFISYLVTKKYLRYPSKLNALQLGLVLGLAMLIKFTSLLLILTILIVFILGKYLCSTSDPESKFYGLYLKEKFTHGVITLIFALFIFNAGYLFNDSFFFLQDLGLKSAPMKFMLNIYPDFLPVPLPKDFIIGMDRQLVENSGFFNVYFLGESSKKGFLSYYFITPFLKTPLPLVLMSLVYLVMVAIRKIKLNFELSFWLFIICFNWIFFALTTNINLGFRYLINLLPFTYLLIGHFFKSQSNNIQFIRLGSIFLVWYMLTGLISYPDYLGYFSDLVGGKSNGAKYLADSNLDWGQDMLKLKKYLINNNIDQINLSFSGPVDPKVYGINYLPLDKMNHQLPTVIEVNHLLGIHPFKKLPAQIEPYHNKTPDMVIGTSLWLFDNPSN